MVLLFTLACNNSNETAIVTPKQISRQPLDTIFAGVRDTVILLIDGEAIIKGHIVDNKRQPKYTLPAWKGQSVTAIVHPVTKGGNVRISQMQQPGGTFDGPFGDSLTYVLKRNGNLRFIIGENIMNGERYNGDFILHITVK